MPVLSLLLGKQFVANLLTVFFFRWPSLSAKRARLARHLTKSILYGIWTFRNRATFCNGKEDHRAIIRYVSYDLNRESSWIITLFLNLASMMFGSWTVFVPWRMDFLISIFRSTSGSWITFVRALFSVSTIRGSLQGICSAHGLCC